MNKRDKYYIDKYFATSFNDGVCSLYKNPSNVKMDTEMYIIRRMQKEGGYDYKALSGNCMTFVAAYRTDTQLRVFTRCNDYAIDLPEEYL